MKTFMEMLADQRVIPTSTCNVFKVRCLLVALLLMVLTSCGSSSESGEREEANTEYNDSHPTNNDTRHKKDSHANENYAKGQSSKEDSKKEADAKGKQEKRKSHISDEECQKLRAYCKKHNLNSEECILVDFSQYSGKERLYVYNLTDNYIEASGRVANGIGKKGLFSKASFSNEPDSWESSLGRYKTGRMRNMNFNQITIPCIEVHGLDPTNSNAHRRGIVIHPGLLTSKETLHPCEPFSQGCFTVGDDTFKKIKSLVKESKKPILLYAYK